MKIEAWIFGAGVFFFVPVALVYGFLTDWNEPVGLLGVLLIAGLSGMIGGYLGFTAKRVGPRPEDRNDAEIHEGAGEQGHFSPWSWWPLVLGLAAAGGFLGLAVGWWIVFIAAGLALVALVGWVFEYSRGDHAH
ncbi:MULTISPECIES: cytochrome c oxidase subunit 4 [Pseudarthrobacter]|uniref:cytochrome c oxidase subunit 4 n=1 Tax=Pseudarthrobacter TaxID=1742993 RepID=UPI0013DC5093|nr:MULTISPECIES: cytochrome c oxidase subunit 4 [Pseudarthrobacter]MDP9996639.1 MFS family permease [Pseudarthrobacter sulfonivorans]QOD05254.1 cytochrome c oxidase subunit 4 [Pseudarthrobacter sp. BIM B-2242]